MNHAKRVYETVAVEAVENEHWNITLDGKAVKTPEGHALSVPSQLLAEAVANEWRAQETQIDPNTMPRTRLLTIAADRVARDRDALIAQLKELAPKLLPYAGPVWKVLAEKRKAGKRILFEGAQGALLDIDFGTNAPLNISSIASSAVCSSIATITPLPAARPSAFTTIGAPCSRI